MYKKIAFIILLILFFVPFLNVTANEKKPDLTVTDIQFTANTKGEKGTLSVTVKNIGGDLTSSDGLENYYDNFSDQLFTYSAESADDVIERYTINRDLPSVSNPLKTNETIIYSWYGYFDTSGNLYIDFKIDNTNELDEVNENNNSFGKIIAINDDTITLPDLKIESVEMNYNESLNEVEGKIKIKNIGNKAAVTNYSFVGLRIHANGGDYFNWESLDVSNNGLFLDVGEDKIFNFVVKNYDLKEGDNKITFYIDQDNKPTYVFGDGYIYESNEYNNTFEQEISISKIYKSEILEITGNNEKYVPGSEMKLFIETKNKNDEIASSDEGYHIQYYVFTSDETDFNGTWINTNSYNAFYDSQDKYWHINYITPEKTGSYMLKMTLYCSRENSRCWYDPIDKGNESKKTVYFSVGDEVEDSINTETMNAPDKIKSIDNNSTSINAVTNNTNALVLKLQRKIGKLEKQVIELEKKLTNLDQQFAEKYKGTMFLDVENYGRLWYVDPESKNRFYFENGQGALSIGSKLATGISYEDIQQIPIGVPDKLYNLKDADGDGLPDRLESALGTDIDNVDTDGDGVSDKDEINNGYNPLSNVKYNYNQSLIDRFEGKMLLQVSGPNSHGEIWYIQDGKRWYGGTEDSMYEIMKARSLGAKSEDIRKIAVGEVENE